MISSFYDSHSYMKVLMDKLIAVEQANRIFFISSMIALNNLRRVQTFFPFVCIDA